MISLVRLDGTTVVVNAELIITLEKTPDTLVTLTTGHRILVKDSIEDVVKLVVDYRRKILTGPQVVEG